MNQSDNTTHNPSPSSDEPFFQWLNTLDSEEDETTVEEYFWIDDTLEETPENPLSVTSMPYSSRLEYRYHTLLKSRLQEEIEQKPLLFPWETAETVYDSETILSEPPLTVPQSPLWFPQLASLPLPVALPSKVLNLLIKGCSQALQSFKPQGAKLVQAVGHLFPEEDQKLNQIANLVLVSANHRSQHATSNTPIDYEQATPDQKMAWSMITAQEIFKQLTLFLSEKHPQAQSRWESTLGIIDLTAQYQSSEKQIAISVTVPQGASLTWSTPQASATLERTYPGTLSFIIPDVIVGQAYALSVQFISSASTPLTFLIVTEQ